MFELATGVRNWTIMPLIAVFGLSTQNQVGTGLESIKVILTGKLMPTDVRQRVFAVLSSVPTGAVVSYGQLADLAGLGKGARQVGRILQTLPEDTGIPWHRVVNSRGNISLKGDAARRQIRLLEAEGVCVLGFKVDMQQYRWNP